jgi:hypothetical protein
LAFASLTNKKITLNMVEQVLCYSKEKKVNSIEFKNIIEGESGNEKTRIKQEWLEKAGFKIIQSFETFFEFRDLKMARYIFKAIWGDKISGKIVSEKITQNIAIYESGK